MNIKNYRGQLPLNTWMILHEKGKKLCTFKLNTYSIIDGVVKWEIQTQEGGIFSGGFSEVIICPSMSIRLYTPIHMEKATPYGYVPKMVFRIPKESLIVRSKDFIDLSSERTRRYDRLRLHHPSPVRI